MEAEMARFAAAPLEERGLLGDLEDRAMAENMGAARAEVERLQAALARAVEALQQGERTNIAAPIAAGVTQASRLADELGRALRVLQQIEAQSISSLREAELRWEHRGDPVRLAGALARERVLAAQAPLREGAEGGELAGFDARLNAEVRRAEEQARIQQRLAEWQRAQTGTAGRPGGGAARTAEADATERQRQAVTDLIRTLELERDILRETDPVLQEMIRHRETLAAATPRERELIEDLIRTRNAEVEVLERVQRQMQEIQSIGQDAFRGILSDLRAGVSGADAFVSALGRIADRLGDLVSDHFFQMLVGAGSGTGGWLGSVVSALFPGRVTANALGDVIGAPTLFAYGDRPGELGLMAEAGPEAIMPLTHAAGTGVGALVAGVETVLPLTRLASGKLGVIAPANLAGAPGAAPGAQLFAMGGVFGHVPAPPPRSAPASGQGALGTAPVIHVEQVVHNYAGVPVETREEPDGRGGRRLVTVIGEATATALSEPGNPARRVMERQFGLRPRAAVR